MSRLFPHAGDPAQEIRLSPELLRPLLERMLVKMSLFQFDASTAAQRILEADLYGRPAHGCAQFLDLLNAIELGDIDPRGRVLTLTDMPAFAVLDGSRAIGPVAATRGAELAVAKARASGVGAVALGNSQTMGAAELYTRLMAAEGVLGICCTSTGGATLSAPGTLQGAVGNTAFSYAVPLGDAPPLVFDAACGETSWHGLQLLKKYGVPLPEGLLRDEAGQAVSDPDLAKVMLPGGGALGFGLSMLCSILAGPLSGGRLPLHKKRQPSAEDSQHFFLAIDLPQFCDTTKFQSEVTTTLEEIREFTPVDASRPVRIPGDRAARCFEEYSRDGIPVHRTVADELKARAEKMKLEAPW